MPPPAPQDQPTGQVAPRGRWLPPAFFLLLTLIGAVLLYARAVHPGPSSGEFWSDSNVINASRGFDRDGLAPTWGLPRIQSAAPLDDTSALYLTYPPGPYWITYAAWSAGNALGFDPLLTARLFAQVCGIASALVLYLVFKRLAHSPAIAALAALFYVLSPPFLSYSAALHHMTYSPLLLFGAMACWLAFEDGRGPRRMLWLAATALLFAVDCWTNLEHMFFFALFVGARTAFHFRWPIILGAGLVGPIPIPMMALRVLHNAQVLGGWDAALDRLLARAADRAGEGRLGLDLGDLWSSWLTRLGWAWPARTEQSLAWNREFVYPVLDPWVVAALGAIALTLALHAVVARRVARARKPKRLALSLVDPGQAIMPLHAPTDHRHPPRFLLWTLPRPGPVLAGILGALLLLGGGLTWFVVMTQHTHPHRFIVLLLMPGLALLLGAIAWGGILSAQSATAHAHGLLAVWVRARAWLLAVAILVVFSLHVRRADVLNLLAPLDVPTHRRVTSQARLDAHAAGAGQSLLREGVTRAILFDDFRVPPRRAAALGVPFVYAIGSLPDTLDPADALLIDAWSQPEIIAALDAIQRLGLPDTVSPPQTRTLVFRTDRPSPRPEATVGVPLAADEPASPRLDRLAWAPTLAGDQFALTALVVGDLRVPGAPSGGTAESDADQGAGGDTPLADDAGLDADPSRLSRHVFILRVLDADGRVLHDARTRLRWSPIRDDARAMLTLLAPDDLVMPGHTIEFSVWDRQRRLAVALTSGAPWMQPAPDGRSLRWPARANAQQQPSPPPVP